MSVPTFMFDAKTLANYQKRLNPDMRKIEANRAKASRVYSEFKGVPIVLLSKVQGRAAQFVKECGFIMTELEIADDLLMDCAVDDPTYLPSEISKEQVLRAGLPPAAMEGAWTEFVAMFDDDTNHILRDFIQIVKDSIETQLCVRIANVLDAPGAAPVWNWGASATRIGIIAVVFEHAMQSAELKAVVDRVRGSLRAGTAFSEDAIEFYMEHYEDLIERCFWGEIERSVYDTDWEEYAGGVSDTEWDGSSADDGEDNEEEADEADEEVFQQ